MWCYVKHSDFDNFVAQNPSLSNIAEDIKLYETNDAIFLPRLFLKNYPSQYLISYPGKKQTEPEKVQFKFNKTLREEQKPIVQTALDLHKKQGFVSGIIKARPGLGKTVLSIYIAAQLGLKTAVIVDSSTIRDQWIQSAYNFTNLTEKDIGIVQQKLAGVEKPFCVMMAQTLCSKIKGNIQNAFELIESGRFGLVIYDEVHQTASTERYSQTSILFRTPNIIGLSATPFKTGAAKVLMENTVGGLIYETKKYDLTPSYRFYYYDSGLAEKYSHMLSRTVDYIRKKAVYNSFIFNSPEYLKIIADKVEELRKDNHVVSVLCMTHKQIHAISDKLTNRGIEHRRFYGAEKEIDKENDNVIICTYAFAGKGFDFKRLSAMILACPLAGKVSLIQSIGRILRSDQDKQKPIVYDLIDMAFASMFIPEVRTKTKIITDEFNCEIKMIYQNHLGGGA